MSDRPVEFPGYELLGEIGRGSIGTVWKARQLRMDRVVALKVMPPAAAAHPRLLARFLREARVVAKLAHENIVAGYDVGEVQGHRFFSMEYVDGQTVAAVLDRGGAMDEKRAAKVVVQVARALDHLAERRLVHRDIKPGNIVLNRRGVAKLCDLGFVRATDEPDETEQGTTIGTPNYISPEQARGAARVDSRSDIYSLGASFYHMVTGSPPFSGRTAAEIMAKHIAERLPSPLERRPELSEPIAYILERMMAKDPADRYSSPGALVRDLEEFVEGTFQIPVARMSDSSLRLLQAKEALPVAEPWDASSALPAAPAIPRIRRRRRRRRRW